MSHAIAAAGDPLEMCRHRKRVALGGGKPDIAVALVVCDAGGAQMHQSAQQVISICSSTAAPMSTGLGSSRRTTVWSPRPNPYTMG